MAFKHGRGDGCGPYVFIKCFQNINPHDSITQGQGTSLSVNNSALFASWTASWTSPIGEFFSPCLDLQTRWNRTYGTSFTGCAPAHFGPGRVGNPGIVIRRCCFVRLRWVLSWPVTSQVRASLPPSDCSLHVFLVHLKPLQGVKNTPNGAISWTSLLKLAHLTQGA